MDYALQLGELVDLQALKKIEEASYDDFNTNPESYLFIPNLDCFTEFVKSAETLDIDDDLKRQSDHYNNEGLYNEFRMRVKPY